MYNSKIDRTFKQLATCSTEGVDGPCRSGGRGDAASSESDPSTGESRRSCPAFGRSSRWTSARRIGRRMVEDEAAESMTDDGELMVAGDLRAANRA